MGAVAENLVIQEACQRVAERTGSVTFFPRSSVHRAHRVDADHPAVACFALPARGRARRFEWTDLNLTVQASSCPRIVPRLRSIKRPLHKAAALLPFTYHAMMAATAAAAARLDPLLPSMHDCLWQRMAHGRRHASSLACAPWASRTGRGAWSPPSPATRTAPPGSAFCPPARWRCSPQGTPQRESLPCGCRLDSGWTCVCAHHRMQNRPDRACRDGYSNIVWTTTPQHAEELCAMTPTGFAEAVNSALQAPAEKGVFSRLLARAAAPVLAAAGGGHAWQDPPRVHGWAGAAPRSFPLHLQHAGQCVSPAVDDFDQSAAGVQRGCMRLALAAASGSLRGAKELSTT